MLKLPQTLTQTTAMACLRDLSATLGAQPEQVVVDAQALSRFDSAALAVLLALRRQALTLHKTFITVGLPQRLSDLAGLYGISELLPAQVGSPVK
ncbi:STAS domain-containing protein [Rhodoferax sp.]|uniref:STAS domain-containing protein n=1 Tax=Rhodoferax sp. TaxID=50421 RepID=UPI00284C3691|nr:STAS domain-containing protein [Rhodoferax sp.]MDR3370005.1 STAS domain-containing protein [Rhodoferax sp.]